MNWVASSSLAEFAGIQVLVILVVRNPRKTDGGAAVTITDESLTLVILFWRKKIWEKTGESGVQVRLSPGNPPSPF